MSIFSWYKQLKRRQRLVLQAITAVVGLQAIMNVFYIMLPIWSLTIYEWNMLVISSDTSFLALYYALYAIWTYDVVINTAREEIYSRLGIPFIQSLVEFGKKIDNRWSQLTPEQQTSILKKTDMIADRLFSSLGKETPRPERKKVKTMRASKVI
jgi:hypothetical protein